MNDFQKYSRLMVLVAAGVFGFIILFAVLILILRLLSVTMFNIPGFDLFFQYVIIIIPYMLFFLAYYYLSQKIGLSKNKLSRFLARVFLITGCIICLFTLTISTLIFLKVKNGWFRLFEDNSHYPLIIQVIIILITAGIIASGDAREKDWMERSR